MATRQHYIQTVSKPSLKDYVGAVIIGLIISVPLLFYFINMKP